MRILIAYATREGQTRKVAEFLADRLRERGSVVSLANVADSSPDPSDFEAIIVAGSVHVSNYEPAVERYASAHSEALSRMHSAFISVSMAAAHGGSNEDLEKWVAAFMQKTGWPAPQVVHVAGALLYRQYNFVTRWIMKSIAKKNGLATDTSRDHEYTDWAAVERFAESFVAGAVSPARRPVSSTAS